MQAGGSDVGLKLHPTWQDQEPSFARHNSNGKLRYSWVVDLGPFKLGRSASQSIACSTTWPRRRSRPPSFWNSSTSRASTPKAISKRLWSVTWRPFSWSWEATSASWGGRSVCALDAVGTGWPFCSFTGACNVSSYRPCRFGTRTGDLATGLATTQILTTIAVRRNSSGDCDAGTAHQDSQTEALRLNETTSTNIPLATRVIAGPAGRLKW